MNYMSVFAMPAKLYAKTADSVGVSFICNKSTMDLVDKIVSDRNKKNDRKISKSDLLREIINDYVAK